MKVGQQGKAMRTFASILVSHRPPQMLEPISPRLSDCHSVISKNLNLIYSIYKSTFFQENYPTVRLKIKQVKSAGYAM